MTVWTLMGRGLLVGALLLSPLAAQCGALPAPSGPVVLTVTGKITASNRGPYDDFEDAFLKYHERSFQKAAAFDRNMLEALGLGEIVVDYDPWPGRARFQGPWLKDVLAAVGASGQTITVLALDGYATTITTEELAAQDWILAVKRDGRYLDIGGRGPLWLVYARRDGKVLTEADEQHWHWAVFLIDLK